MKQIQYTPIGIIHSPFSDPRGMPIQPRGTRGVKGRIELAAKYGKGLRDIRGLSHIILLYHFHRTTRCSMQITPLLDKRRHGIFATRAPERPNPIGISVVRLTGIRGRTLYISEVDILDGTPCWISNRTFRPAVWTIFFEMHSLENRVFHLESGISIT